MAPSLRLSKKEAVAAAAATTSKLDVMKRARSTSKASIVTKTTESPPKVVTPFAFAKKTTAWKTPTEIAYDQILPSYTVKAVVADFYVRILGMPPSNQAVSLIQQKFRFSHADRLWIIKVMEDVRSAYDRGEQYDYTKLDEE